MGCKAGEKRREAGDAGERGEGRGSRVFVSLPSGWEPEANRRDLSFVH